MDNFRRYNAPKGRPVAVDGIVGSRSRGTAPRPGHSTPASSATPPPKVMLDNFRKTDGFRPAAQPMIQTSAKPLGRQPVRDKDGSINLALPKTTAPTKLRGKKKSSVGKKIKRASILMVVLVVLMGGFLFGKGFLKARNIFRGGGGAAALDANVDPSKLNGEGDGRVNILMLGKGGDGHEAPDLTDTVIIASIDPIQNEASLLSIPRDLWVKTDYGSSKINAVYANAKYAVLAGKRTSGIDKKAEEAGVAAVEAAVEDSMGIPIHYYMMADFSGFKQAVDAVGGVDVDVKTAVFENMLIDGKPYTLDVKTGQQHFDGRRALSYSRSRYTSPRGDFDRSQRQREIIVALKNKTLSAGTFANPKKVSSLIDAFGDHIQTNMSLSEVMRIVELGKVIPAEKIASLSFVDPPNVLVTTGNVDGQSVVLPKAGLGNFTEIQSFVRNALKDAFLKKEEATISVYNGTGVNGLAGTKAEELKSFGYTIGTVANAPNKNYPKTILVDLRNGQKRYTKNYLEKRLGVTAVTSLPDNTITAGNEDFVIILGNNESAAQ